MCGVAGVLYFERPDPPPLARAGLEAMAGAQRHRGPDDSGVETIGPCGLASQRLSILDLSPLGHMPMATDDGRLSLVQNGEIYNFIELRDELRARGHRFRSDGDTEVILRAFQEWGPRCTERFVGMWSFALFDRDTRTLHLSRDRLGIKPLYVHQTSERIVFASEIKAILAFIRSVEAPDQRPRAHLPSIATYMATGLVDGLADTFFKGITRFPPATNARVSADGQTSYERYWDLAAEAAARRAGLNGQRGAPWELLHATLDEAVRVHLRSDVPLGVCLSGGLDSSAIVGLASGHVPDPVRTFTVYFDEGPAYDERAHARPIVERFGARAAERCVDAGNDLVGTLQKIVWHLDEPSLAMGVLPQWHVMQLAREGGVTVVLDGQGGDEIFAGYTNYASQHLYGLLRSDPLRFPSEIAGLAQTQGWPAARSAARSALAMRVRAPMAPTVAGKPDAALLARHLWPLADVSHDEWRLWPRVFDDWLTNVLYHELVRTRLPALLRYEDRLSMAFSIESRVPFLDHRLVELAFALPDSAKRAHGWSKYGLRRALEGRLPDSVVWRKDKKGFPTPVGVWLKDRRGAGALDLLRDQHRRTRDLFPQAALDAFIVEHTSGTADRAWQLWRALSTELWFAAFDVA
ncbi:MAG: asparagine synthase (glutamine-hydrolyzing) [Chloroflexota bacterium]